MLPKSVLSHVLSPQVAPDGDSTGCSHESPQVQRTVRLTGQALNLSMYFLWSVLSHSSFSSAEITGWGASLTEGKIFQKVQD